MSLIFKKMSAALADVGAITKDKTNTQQGFKFRSVDQFINALHPILVKHGLIPIPRCMHEEHELKDVVRSNGKAGVDRSVFLRMEYDFYAEDGSKLTVGPIPGEGLDSGDKATNKAMSAALKYMCIQTFWVPTEDIEDADKVSPEIGSSSGPKVIGSFDPAKRYFEPLPAYDEELPNFDELPKEKPKANVTKTDFKGAHDHAWKPSKFPDKLTGKNMDYCITCKLTRPSAKGL